MYVSVRSDEGLTNKFKNAVKMVLMMAVVVDDDDDDDDVGFGAVGSVQWFLFCHLNSAKYFVHCFKCASFILILFGCYRIMFKSQLKRRWQMTIELLNGLMRP